MRNVGTESKKSFLEKSNNGFFSKYMHGKGIEIGYKGYADKEAILPILEGCIGIDMDYPGYDGKILPFPDNSVDYVYSSHALEHIVDFETAIKEWHRVTKVGGHIVIVVPHMYLYEKKWDYPSNWNGNHKRFYTPSSLLGEVETSLLPNSYRVRFLQDEDNDFDYNIPPNIHSGGQYEITLVLEKIQLPNWSLIE